MTGLNLEMFLHLLRADLGAWASLVAVALLLALMTWTSWGSRRALRKCLVLSVALHIGLVLYGSTLPALLPPVRASQADDEVAEAGIRQIRVAPWSDKEKREGAKSPDGKSGRRAARWDRPNEALALADPSLRPSRPEATNPELERADDSAAAEPLVNESVAPEVNPPEPNRPDPRAAAEPANPPAPAPSVVAPGDPDEIAKAVVKPETEAKQDPLPEMPRERRIAPERSSASNARSAPERKQPEPVPLPEAPALPSSTNALADADAPEATRALEPPTRPSAIPDPQPIPARSRAVSPFEPDSRPQTRVADASAPRAPGTQPAPDSTSVPPVERPRAQAANGSRTGSGGASEPEMPEADVRQRARSARSGTSGRPGRERPSRSPSENPGPVAFANASPSGSPGFSGAQRLVGPRPLSEVPKVYRSRLDPNRSLLAQRAGASAASEQAVERALDWMARHQDSDGRWNGGSLRVPAHGLEAESRDSFTKHCPPGEKCIGECEYVEADTALTGLSLLAYLGAGYTHLDGKYAETVRKGLSFLLRQQKPDGDLRGVSASVGMYCHAMAALALSEAFALTGDERLRGPVERAVDFIVNAQATDGMSWRYKPRDSAGDTSILGWVVLLIRSAQVEGITVAAQAPSGALKWLEKVAEGEAGGLARYQPFPGKKVTETMTAEAWVCRQLLGVGGPGPASTEAAAYLLDHAPDRSGYNLYYWYYGTLALYQHGGPAWTRWNSQVRDQLVHRQIASGHSSGSWDPDDDREFGAKGGRLYSTALATLTLEVYYRYLRFYDEPNASPRMAPAPERSTDPGLRRAGSRATKKQR